jgi:site-specific recombinase XerD
MQIQTLVRFDAFANQNGAASWNDLPDLIAPFVNMFQNKYRSRATSSQKRASVTSQARLPVEEMLKLVLPGFDPPPRRDIALPFREQVPGYFEYLREERGLRPATLNRYKHYLRAFEHYLRRVDVVSLSEVTPATISGFVTERGQRLGHSGMYGAGGCLRSLFKYAYRQRIVPVDLARAVPRGREYRQARLPRAISWDEVERMLEGIDRRCAIGRRDYAIMLLLVSYGLRARELAAMKLEDIDWTQNLLRIPIRKGGHSTIYPLSVPVGEAIIEYLREGRPQTEDRHLFLTAKAPFVATSHWVISGRTSTCLRAAGINVRRAGSHTLRHTCVQRLVEADVPFKTIGDYVGHSSPQSTLVYGKVALHKLRQLTIGEAEDML